MNDPENLLRVALENPLDNQNLKLLADQFEESGDDRSAFALLAIQVNQIAQSTGMILHPFQYTVWPASKLEVLTNSARHAFQKLSQELENLIGDGQKIGALIASTTIRSAIDEIFRGANAGQLADELEATRLRLSDVIEGMGARIETPDEILCCLRAAAHNQNDIAEGMLFAIRDAGADGVIHVNAAKASQPERITFRAEEGMHFPLPIYESASDWHANECAIVVCDSRLDLNGLAVLRSITSAYKSAMCICSEVDSDVEKVIQSESVSLLPLSINRKQARLNQTLQDICVASGANPVSDWKNLSNSDLGFAEAVETKKSHLILHDPAGVVDDDYRQSIYSAMESSSANDREWQQERAAALFGRIIHVNVYGKDEEETNRLKGLALSSLHSGRALIEAGKVPGGGASWLYCANSIKADSSQNTSGANCAIDGLAAPLKYLTQNSGQSFTEISEELRANGGAFSAKGDDTFDPLDSWKLLEATVRLGLETAIFVLRELNKPNSTKSKKPGFAPY